MRFLYAAVRVGLVLTLAPAPLLAQNNGGVRCNDGTYSRRSGIGACWFSGGVATAPAAVAATPAAVSAKGKPANVAKTKPAKNAKPDLDRPKKSTKPRSSSNAGGSAAGWTGAGSATRGSSNSSTMIKSRARPAPSITKHAPKAKPAPRGATARCMDGSYSYATQKRKACSKQGGVAGWLRADIPPE